MENRIVLAIVIIIGVAGLMVYAGHFSTLVSGSENPAPVVQTPGPGPLSSSGSAGSLRWWPSAVMLMSSRGRWSSPPRRGSRLAAGHFSFFTTANRSTRRPSPRASTS